MAEHIQTDIEGTSIQRWELDHGVFRIIRNGCEYVVCSDFDAFRAKCEADRQDRIRQAIADAQEAAYLPQ